ncbi:MAG: hypothetical protein JXA41_11855 [Deltaproteobacteria bacterium]|nr:hypothetical protein [Deltaproteobacteria bacterium]
MTQVSRAKQAQAVPSRVKAAPMNSQGSGETIILNRRHGPRLFGEEQALCIQGVFAEGHGAIEGPVPIAGVRDATGMVSNDIKGQGFRFRRHEAIPPV